MISEKVCLVEDGVKILYGDAKNGFPTSLPLMKMVTLRVLLFAINCCFGKVGTMEREN